MPKDKKNKPIKNDLKSALNSNIEYDDQIEDLPYAFANEDEPTTTNDDVISFTNITVNTDDIDDDADKHIQVTFGEAVENLTKEVKVEPKETSKETIASRKMLKKNNGTAVSRMIKDKPSKKQRQTVIFGVIISVLVCIGLYTTISTINKSAQNFINATSLKTEMIDVVFPLVIIDIPEFETPTNLDSSVIISTAIWSFITDTNKDMNKYQQDDLGSIYVPDVDIEFYVRKLYGSGIEIKHQTINDSNIQIVYNELEKMYIIESNPSYLPYSPRIEDVKRTGSIYTLTVSYILPTVSWSLSNYDISSQEADKIMEYRLQKIDDNYHFLSVKLIAINDHKINTNDETEYMGNYTDNSTDNSEVFPDMLTDEQIANDIMAEEAKKNEEDSDEDGDEDEDTLDNEEDDEDEDETDETDEDEEEESDDEDDTSSSSSSSSSS